MIAVSAQNIIRSWKGQLYITAAVRTPLGQLNGVLKDVQESRLGAIVLDSIFHRSCVDKKDVDHLILNCKSESIVEMLKDAGLSGKNCTTVSGHGGLNALSSAVQLLLLKNSNVVVVGGASYESQSSSGRSDITHGQTSLKNDYFQKAETQFLKTQCGDAFLEEIQRIFIPGHPRLNRKEVALDRDEVKNARTNSDEKISMRIGATACILTTGSFNRANISPVAYVLGLCEANTLRASIHTLLEESNLKLCEISALSINGETPHQHINMVEEIQKLGIDDKNIDGTIDVMGNHSEIGGLQSLIHLIYSLKPREKGIAIHSSFDSSISLLVEKLPIRSEFISSGKPVLNLYTKVPCPLCDELKVNLLPYMSRIHLEEVFLTPDSNLNRLYRYEIPVLFLGGRFVCKNRFDGKVFEKMLADLELGLK